MTVRSRILPFAALSIAALALAGCSTAAAPAATPTPTAAGPVTVTNCDTTVTFDKAPQRVVAIKSTSTEMLLALGLGDRIVGTGYQDGPVPAEWEKEAASIPLISDKIPSQEVVLEAEPDLVYSGWESAFSAEGAGTRVDLDALGVASYVSPSACQSAGQPAKLTFDNIYSDIEEVAAIFRVDASEFIAQQKAIVKGIKKNTEGHTALWFSSGSDIPFVGAGTGAPDLIMDTIGLTNIASSLGTTWASYSWEAVVDANPDVIVLISSQRNTAEKKIELLESNPATANLDAVKNKRYLVLPFPAGEAGVRSASAAADLAAQLAALDLP